MKKVGWKIEKEVKEDKKYKGNEKTTIYATDFSPLMVTQTRSKFEQENWSQLADITIQEMPMENLSFPSDFFDLLITNFGIFALQDDKALIALKHIYRTLKPGGKAVLTVWKHTPRREALISAHQKTRNTDTVLPIFKKTHWHDASFLSDLLGEAGFEKSRKWLGKER